MTTAAQLLARLRGLDHDEATDLVVAAARREPHRLTELVEQLGGELRDDPGGLGAVAAACAAAAAELGRPAESAQAHYLRAQASMMVGELAAALELIDGSRREFERAGEPGAALRTNLGRANVLHALGRSGEALTACDAILAGVAGPFAAGLDPDERLALTAAAQQNRGLCLELAGRYPEALAAYGAAEAGYQQMTAVRNLGEVVNDRGLLLLAMGRVGEALRAFTEAAEVFARGGFRALHATALCSRAEAELLQGSYAACLDTLAAARAVFAEIDVPIHEHDRTLVAARAYEALNLWPEAATTYDDAVRFFAGAEMVLEEARARWGLGRARGALEPGTVPTELDAAIELFRRSEHPQWLAAAVLDRARLAHGAGDHGTARAAANEAAEISAQAGAPVETVGARILLAALLTAEGRLDLAAAELDRARLDAAVVGIAPLAIALEHASARHALAVGDLEAARRQLVEVVDGIERLQGALTHEAIATMFLADKLDAFGALIELDIERGDAAAALRTAERARARVLTELSAGRLASGHGPQAHAAVALEPELNAVYSELFSPSDRSPEQTAELRRRAVELEHQISTARLDAIGRDLRAGRVGGDPRSSAPVAGDLVEPKVPVLSWYCLGEDIVTFVVDAGIVTAHRSLAVRGRVEQLLGELAVHHDRVRTGGSTAVRYADRLERACRQTLTELYRLLVEPVEAALPRAVTGPAPLVVVPHGPLHGVPLHALHDGARYLLERFVVSYAPSLDVAARAPAAPAFDRRRAVVAATTDDLAPELGAEGLAVARCFSDVSFLSGAAATASSVLEQMSGAGVVHLACHAMFRDDNPMFSALRLADRWVTAHELLTVDLRDALVTLSTCDSGRSLAVGGDELLGLVRAVLGAGAATLVASLWPADDHATASLMTDLYRALDRLGPAEALRGAQLQQLARSPHPYHWAPFVVIGAR